MGLGVSLEWTYLKEGVDAPIRIKQELVQCVSKSEGLCTASSKLGFFASSISLDHRLRCFCETFQQLLGVRKLHMPKSYTRGCSRIPYSVSIHSSLTNVAYRIQKTRTQKNIILLNIVTTTRPLLKQAMALNVHALYPLEFPSKCHLFKQNFHMTTPSMQPRNSTDLDQVMYYDIAMDLIHNPRLRTYILLG
jgi:hypothetical protein